jgi:phage FluMu protein Com
MTEYINWVCPFCKTAACLPTEHKVEEANIYIDKGNKYGQLQFKLTAFICPNPKCQDVTIDAVLSKKKYSAYVFAKRWSLLPERVNSFKKFPCYIPEQLRKDYEEACLIKELSPKAAATLARRCLQGMIRDFWEIKGKRSLHDEIEAIQDKVAPDTWEAIMAVKKIGNIGAHMEKDVNLIVDVEPEEAELLIKLIEDLFEDWYIQRYERQQRLASIVELAAEKERIRKGLEAPIVAE